MHLRACRLVLSSLLLCGIDASAQSLSPGKPVDRIRGEVDERRIVRLAGNLHPMARPEYDEGPTEPDFRMQRMILSLQSSAAQEQALERLIEKQQDPGSPQYHHYLSASEFADRFGVSRGDVNRVTAWLEGHGMTVDEVPEGNRSIVFSGTASQVQSAFGVEIRRFRVNGLLHHATASDPEIPEAFAGVVRGPVTLHDFPRKPMHAQPHAVLPDFTYGGYHYLAPGDFAAIYNAATLYGNGIDGTGQTVAIVGRTNILLSDVQTFRSQFGLPSNDPAIVLNGSNPGIISSGEETEADLDVEWSGAIAPKATIKFVVSASTNTTDGVDLSAQYIVSHNLAPVLSVSFGSCEAYMGSSELSFYNGLWQQAAAEGITAFVASGDSGAAGCDYSGASTATGGRAVNGLCSSPYSVCVGGTEFSEGSNAGLYWSGANSTGAQASALGYIPEAAWNESGSDGGYGLAATGGGASNTYSKPAWQNGLGVPADGKRDVPDVALSAAGHDGYLIYQEGGLYYVGGTSAASPSFAGLMALVNQNTGSSQGNANVNFYALAGNQANGGAAVFHAMTGGDNTVPGVVGFTASANYNQATGLGSVDANVMVNHWTDASSGGASLSVSAPSAVSVGQGSSGTASLNVAVANSFNSLVTISVSGLPSGVTASLSKATLPAPGSGSSTLTWTASSTAPTGTCSVQIAASGGGHTSQAVIALTVLGAQPTFTVQAAPVSLSMQQGTTGSVTVTALGAAGFNAAVALSVSGGPMGVATQFSSATIAAPGSGTSTLSISPSATMTLGNYSLKISATANGITRTASVSFSVTQTPPCTLTPASSTLSVTDGASTSLLFTCPATQGAASTSLNLSVSGVPSGVTVSFSPTHIAPGGQATLRVSAIVTAPAGSVNLSISATGGPAPAVATLPLTVIPAGSFTLSASATSLNIRQGASGMINFTTAHSGGFNFPITYSASGMPTGVTAVFSPSTIAAPGDGVAALTLQADSRQSPPGTYPITVTASSITQTTSKTFALTITAIPGFTFASNSANITIPLGSQGTAALVVSNPVAGFNSSVTLSIPSSGAGSLPAGVTATFSPAAFSAPGTGTSSLSLTVSNSAAFGSYPVAIKATGGGVANSVQVTLVIPSPAGFSVGVGTHAASSVAASVARGSSVVVPIQTSVTGNFSSSVSLTVAGSLSGITVSLSPAVISHPAGGTSNLILIASKTAATVSAP